MGPIRQRGNILFLILLAVVLFAALSYAVTRDQSGQEKNASAEKADLLASQLVQVGSLLENTMMRAMTVYGVPEYGFDLSDANSTATANGTCTQANCKMFTGTGGPVALPALPDWASSPPANPKARFYVGQIVNVGTTAPDVFMLYTYLTMEVCLALQRITSSTDIPLNVYDALGGSNRDYSGTLTAMPASTAAYGDENPSIKGHRAFCHSNDGSQRAFIYVLIAR